MSKNIVIVVPARYGSTRFPGKPLALIAGRSMLSRVVDIASEAAQAVEGADVRVVVATDDQRIVDHAAEIGAEAVMTGVCSTGSDRALAAVYELAKNGYECDFVVNLQGDAPLTPVGAVVALIEGYLANSDSIEVVTPVYQLSWEALDSLRRNKVETPFSGTTAVVRDNGEAIWFSKQIIPAVRKEDRGQPMSPVYQHLGLYGYRLDALRQFCALPEGHYEALEGLEQLRFLENGMRVQTVKIDLPHSQTGVDSPEDVARAEALLDSIVSG